jgi:hypothetical protein
MKLKEEALEYAENELKNKGGDIDKLTCAIDFVNGANSKYVQVEKIKAQINILNEILESENSLNIKLTLNSLKEQLKTFKQQEQ